jgi:hypothetical protein
MNTEIIIGPQRYTVPVEREAEVRRLLWAQLRLTANVANDVRTNINPGLMFVRERDRDRARMRVIQGGIIADSELGLKGPGSKRTQLSVGRWRPGLIRPTG